MEDTNLYQILVEVKGYSRDEAVRVVNDVLEARKVARELELKKYLGKRVKAEFGELQFEVVVKDVKIDTDGKVQFQVTPLNGNKSAWVKKISN